MNNYFTDENHPNARDEPAGTTVFEKIAKLDQFTGEEVKVTVVMTWTKYSCSIGYFNAIKTEWFFDDANKKVFLEHVIIHSIDSWSDGFTAPAALIPDSHKRIIRDIARERYQKQRFRGLNLYPH